MVGSSCVLSLRAILEFTLHNIILAHAAADGYHKNLRYKLNQYCSYNARFITPIHSSALAYRN
jgi:hypothetical protein